MTLLSLFILSDKGSSPGINWPTSGISFSLSVSLAKLVRADIAFDGVASILFSSQWCLLLLAPKYCFMFFAKTPVPLLFK